MTNFELPPLGFELPRARLPGLGADGLRIQEPARPGGDGGGPAVAPAGSFAASLGHLESLQDEVAQKTRGLVLGEDVELHDVMLATSKSEVAFNLMIEVRNKLVEAWEKLSRSAV